MVGLRLKWMIKLDVLRKVQGTMSVPYQMRAKINLPILNKLVDEKIDEDSLIKAYKEEEKNININYEEF